MPSARWPAATPVAGTACPPSWKSCKSRPIIAPLRNRTVSEIETVEMRRRIRILGSMKAAANDVAQGLATDIGFLNDPRGAVRLETTVVARDPDGHVHISLSWPSNTL